MSKSNLHRSPQSAQRQPDAPPEQGGRPREAGPTDRQDERRSREAESPHQQDERRAISRFLRQHQYVILRSIILYLVLGMLYIYLSDVLVFKDQNVLEIQNVSLIKGWLFVFFSALFFLIMLYRRRAYYEKALNELDNQEQQIALRAHSDALTQLPSRQYLEEDLQRRIQQAAPDKAAFGLIYLDLDDFRLANDLGGYPFGDQILRHVADTLLSIIRPGDLACRMAADEFAVLLDPLTRRGDLLAFSDRLRAALRKEWTVDQHIFYLTVSAGATLCPLDGEQTDELLQHAEQAMVSSKELGKNFTSLYYPGIHQHKTQEIARVTDLRQAIDEKRFLLHYQPQFWLADGRLRGVESLLRRVSPEEALIYPDAFVPLAESTGLIHPLTGQVLERLASQTKAWHGQQLLPAVVAVNISSQQLQQNNLIEQVLPLHKELAAIGCQLELEITENALMEDPDEAVRVISELKAAGIDFALDDFGTGYSSLTWLRQLPVDLVKIDRHFVQTMLNTPRDAEIVRSIIDLAHKIGLRVLAEGIETREQFEWLIEAGCDMGQGYYMARPADPATLQALLTARRIVHPDEAP